MKKILKFIGKYKIFLVLSVLLATVSVILQLYVPILFGDAIDQIVAEHQVQFDAMVDIIKRNSCISGNISAGNMDHEHDQ